IQKSSRATKFRLFYDHALCEVVNIRSPRYDVLERDSRARFEVSTADGLYSCSCADHAVGVSCRHIAEVQKLERRLFRPASRPATKSAYGTNKSARECDGDQPFSIFATH